MSSISLSTDNLTPLLRGSEYAKQVDNMPAEVTDLGNGVVVERRGAQFKMTGDAKMSLRAKAAAYEAAQAGGKAGQAMFETYRKTHPEEFGEAAVARDNALLSGRMPEPPSGPASSSGSHTEVKDGQNFTAPGDKALNLTGGSRVNVTGSAASDFIAVLYNATVYGLAGQDRISASDYATLDGGAGDDWLSAGKGSTLVGGDGDDVLSAHGESTLLGGAGNDRLNAHDNAEANGGSGDDRIEVGHDARVTDSDGDNDISAYANARVTTGAGNDRISAYEDAVVDAGGGTNYVVVGAGSTVRTGSGEDYVRVGRSSDVVAGAGNDRISVEGESVIHFNQGDGHDVVEGLVGLISRPDGRLASSTLAFGAGISPADLSIRRSGGDLVVNIGSDSVTLRDVERAGIPTMTFADGSTLNAGQVQAMADRTEAAQAAQRLRSASQVYQTQLQTTGTAL